MAESAPACPRCAYDLSGLVASWKDACPLEGVCSECGLEFAWRNVLNWSLTVPRWSFEHARRVSPARWADTNWRTLNPLRFWRELRLEHRVNMPRLIAGVVAVLLAFHIVVAGVTAGRLYSVGVGAMGGGTGMRRVGAGAVVPNMAPVRSPGNVFQAYGGSIVAAAIWPYSSHHDLYGASGGRWWGYGVDSGLGLWTVFIGAFWLTVAPGFLVLRETFRRCRVRFVHVLRGVAYSAAGPAVVVVGAVLWLAAVPGVVHVGRAAVDLNAVGIVGAVVMACGWLCVYWSVFVVRYLRLTHAAWVAGSMLLIAGLCASLATTCAWLERVGKLW